MTYRKTMLSASIVAALLFAGSAVAGPATSADVTLPASAVEVTNQADQPQAAQDADQNDTQAAKQANAKKLETITVTGVLGSQMRAIQLKRYAPSIQDSISAENIGQLPDTTITDSLQRVTGVQISRSGGEGSSLNVRGLSQVQTLMNGESFLPATNIVGTQPDFSGIPAQLFQGVDVIKSPTSTDLTSGLSGTVNLRTRRPWDMKMGWTFAGALSGTRGSEVGKTEPKGNFLVSFNDDGKWGFVLSAAHSSLTHENSSFTADQYGGFLWDETNGTYTGGSVGAGHGYSAESTFTNAGLPLPPFFTKGDPALGQGVDLNGDGKYNGAFYASHMFTPNQSRLKRDRTGINASFQFAFGAGVTLTADAFYTHLDQNNRQVVPELMPTGWMAQSKGFTDTTKTGSTITNANGGQSDIYTVQGIRYWPGDIASSTQNAYTRSTSRNFNVELKYDQGGFFAGEFRAISANAQNSLYATSLELVQSNGAAWTDGTGKFNSPDGIKVFNKNGYAPYTDYMDIGFNGSWPTIALSQGLADRLSDPGTYAFKGLNGLGGHERAANMNIARFDGHFRFDNGNQLDFGLRNSIRTANNTGFFLASKVFGCDTMYHAFDIQMNGNCKAGNATDGWYRASGKYSGMSYDQLPAQIKNNWKYYGNVAGTGMGMWAMDPEAMDDPRAFMSSMYDGVFLNANPQQTWDVKLRETTFYVQGDFVGEFGPVPFDANVGARVVRTNLHVTQNMLGPTQDYGLNSASAGQAYTDRSYTDILPTANIALHFTPELTLRGSWSKNMVPLNLDQWGGGQAFNYALNNTTGVQQVASGSEAGNPTLDPWRSTNAGMSLEYYLSDKSMLSLAFFRIRVDSFIKATTITRCDVPNKDGSVTQCIPFTTQAQGNGVTLHGWEFNWRQALDGLPGFLSNTGFTANWTYSPSNTGVKDMAGNAVPFANNSKYTGNLVLWYQGDHLQVRLAGNYRSKQAVAADYAGISGFEQYLDAQTFVDASVAYKFNDNVSVFLKGSNLTGESQRYYLVWKNQFAHSINFEKRYELGVSVNF